MHKGLNILGVALLGLCSCAKDRATPAAWSHAEHTDAATHREKRVSEQQAARKDGKERDEAQEAAVKDADNTARNRRDRNDETLTPADQSNAKGDVAITTAIRRDLVGRDNLSIDAKNIKIITRDAVVTLRGPVNSAEEKSLIDTIARQAAGVTAVDNQLEVVAH